MSPSSASRAKRASRTVLAVAACYAAYVLGSILVVTGHELGHFAGAGRMPSAFILTGDEDDLHAVSQPAIALYLSNLIPVATGLALFDPASYAQEHRVAASWLGHVAPDRQTAVNLTPFLVAVAGTVLAGAAALAWPRLPVLTFGLGFATGGFYTVHHLVESGLPDIVAFLMPFLLLGAYLLPAGVALRDWCQAHVRRRTFRAHLPKVYGTTVLPAPPMLPHEPGA